MFKQICLLETASKTAFSTYLFPFGGIGGLWRDRWFFEVLLELESDPISPGTCSTCSTCCSRPGPWHQPCRRRLPWPWEGSRKQVLRPGDLPFRMVRLMALSMRCRGKHWISATRSLSSFQISCNSLHFPIMVPSALPADIDIVSLCAFTVLPPSMSKSFGPLLHLKPPRCH